MINFDNGYEIGYAMSSICETQFPGITFSSFSSNKSSNNTKLSVSNKYRVPSQYSISVEGWNSISKQVSHTEVFVLRDRCTQPRSKIKYVGETFEKRSPVYRSESFTLFLDNFIDCPAANGVTFLWRFKFLDNNETLVKCVRNESGSFPQLAITKRSLQYGVYRIDVTLILGGTHGVSASTSGFVEIVKSSLVGKIGGGSMMRRGFDAFIEMDGSSSHDPDFGLIEDKDFLFTWVCIDSTGTNVTIENAFKVLVNGTYPPKNMEGKCFPDGQSRRAGQFPKVVMDSSILKSTGKDRVEIILILIVSKGSRVSTNSQLLEQVVGTPPSLSTE